MSISIIFGDNNFYPNREITPISPPKNGENSSLFIAHVF